jgi:HEAT repeat protein
VLLEPHTQVRHATHLFLVICASVIARNVAVQEVLEAIGPQVLGDLYIASAIVTGLLVTGLGWIGRSFATRRVVQLFHAAAALAMAAAFIAPERVAEFAVVKLVAMDVMFALMLLGFGLMMGASLGPREARQAAAPIGAGGIIGGLVAGSVLAGGALLIGSRPLYLIASACAAAPILFLPYLTQKVQARGTGRAQLAGEPSDVPALTPYGRWVALTTLVMVAATTMIDYQFRFFGSDQYSRDDLTAFFGVIFSTAGVATLVFQLLVLKRFLDRIGLFGTAMVMPAVLILSSAMFGAAPAVVTLGLLKVVDSGANMSLQQATGGLLLAPLSPGARAVWQGRIDGIAKRSGQILAGLFIALFPWAPTRIVPVVLILCALWIGCIIITRTRYVQLLTEMLGASGAATPQVDASDGSTIRLLITELSRASTERAGVILDLLEQAGYRAPAYLLKRIAEADPAGPGTFMVIDHLAKLDGTKHLIAFANSPHPGIAKAAILALAEVDPRVAQHRARQLLDSDETSELLRAVAASILAELNPKALALCGQLADSPDARTRLAVVEALATTSPGAHPEIGRILCRLSEDDETSIARPAIEALARHPSEQATETVLGALERRNLRGAAMRALAEMGAPVVPRVAEELDKRLQTPPVASALTWALGRIGASGGVAALVGALRAPIVQVRLDAAVALSTMSRRRAGIEVPSDAIEGCYEHELAFYCRMRQASLAGMPETPAGELLRRTLRQRGLASLETLFRMLSISYPLDAMQGAFQAMSSNDRRRRQVALELLDNTLDPELSRAISGAVGGSKQGRGGTNGATLVSLASEPDPFLASLARAVMIDASGGRKDAIEAARTKGDSMAFSVVDQILELQSLSIFSQSSAEDLAEVASLISTRRVPKGTVLFREGDLGDAMYVVRRGEMALSRDGKLLDHVGAGEACGIVACLDQLPREMTATATRDTSVLAISADGLLQLLADRPLLMYSVFRALTAAIRQQLDRVALGKKQEMDWSW